MRTLFALTLAASAFAACPNQCSSHGECKNNDICTCYSNWQGPDCSLRTCAFGNSWALDAENPHSYEECSGAGLCDRASGECQCFAGFSGYACQRRACPNDCSGHGICRLLSELKTAVPYSSWDSEQIQACVCDAGYFGTDCTQRSCPTGDDPLTLCNDANLGMSQEIRVTLGSGLDYDPTTADGASTTSGEEGMDLFGTSATANFNAIQDFDTSAQLHVGATDINGQVYYAPASSKAVFAKDDYTRAQLIADAIARGETSEVSPYDPGVDSIELVLENIPGFKVRNVKVQGRFTSLEDGNGIAKVMEKRFVVSFIPETTNSANFGIQNNLVCDSGYGCSSSGCQPIVRMPFLYRYASTVSEQASIDEYPVKPAPAELNFFTGSNNLDSSFAALKFVRMDPSSMPRMPPGVAVDTGVTFTNLDRYDMRIAVACQDPADPYNSDSPIDVYWTKVTYTNTNITTDVVEYYSNPSSQSAGVFSAQKQSNFVGTLNGFTYRGFIPNDMKASIPDAPGVVLSFPNTNMIHTDQYYKFFEILVKLPTCLVTPITQPGYIDVRGDEVNVVSADVENIECANRGQCNRDTGACECFQGYYGIACHHQTVLV